MKLLLIVAEQIPDATPGTAAAILSGDPTWLRISGTVDIELLFAKGIITDRFGSKTVWHLSPSSS